MTGWRLGWIVAPRSICGPARDYLNHALYGSPGFLQHGAVAAFTEDVPEVDEMKRIYRERRDMFYDTLAGLNSLDCIKPQSGIFCIVGIDKLGLPAMEFAERLYAEEGVSVLPGRSVRRGAFRLGPDLALPAGTRCSAKRSHGWPGSSAH